MYGELNMQICNFIKVAVTRLFCTTMCQSLSHVKFRWKGTPRQEATPGDRMYLRISVQLEELYLLNHRETTVFLISSLTKQVLSSLHKSAMITDLVKNYAKEKQKESIAILYHTKNQK